MKSKSASQSLEEKARTIADWSSDDIGVGEMLRQEIALTLDHLDRHRQNHKRQLHSLLKTECYINTELKEVYHRTPIRSLDPLPDRGVLRKRLMKVEQERRKCFGVYDLGVQWFHKKLLELVQRWERVGR